MSQRDEPCCGTCYCWRPDPAGPDRAGACWVGYPTAGDPGWRAAQSCHLWRCYPRTDALGRPFVGGDYREPSDHPVEPPVQGRLFA